ncbi:MAG: 6-bladed beta-propeller [Balneola sp.]
MLFHPVLNLLRKQMMRIILLLVSLLLLSNTGISQNLEVVGEINYKFENSSTYRVFGANESYLTWFDYQKGTLFSYNLKTKEIGEGKLTQGRGPSEYLQPTDIYLNDENNLYLADFPNSKLVVWSIKEKKFEDDIKVELPPFRISGTGEEIFVFNLSNSDHPITHVKLATKENTSLDLEGNFFENSKPSETLFNKDGTLIYQNNQIIHLSKYRNLLSFFNIDKEKKNLKVETDRVGKEQKVGVKQTELADGSVQQSLDVSNLLLSLSFAKHPNDNSLAIVFQDNRSTPIYDSKSIFNYSLTDREVELENPSIFDFNIDQMISNSRYIFVFSKEEGKVYILE